MSYLVSRRGGLLVAEAAADFAAVSRALKDLDRDLILDLDVLDGRACYVVLRHVGGDRPPLPVYRWMNDYGEPLPLSHALVDAVRRHRADPADPDAANRRLRDEASRNTLGEAYEAAADMIPRIRGRRIPVLHRGPSLRAARWRRRQQGRGHL